MRKTFKRARRVVLGTGYLDTADGRRRVMLWNGPLDGDDTGVRRVNFVAQSILGRRVRLVAEVLP